MTAPYLAGAWYPPAYRTEPEKDNARPCGCPSDPLVFGHQVRHLAPVACGESGLNPESGSDGKGPSA
jgi:hypothetical protein